MASQAPSLTGITIKTAPHGANELGSVGYTQTSLKPITSVETLLQASCYKKSLECKSLLQSSFQQHLNQPLLAPLYASSNGFVKGAIDAYNQHHHFVIRPEDVWFAILTQFSCYVNAHAEELRSKFVSHEGQKALRVELPDLSRFDLFAEEMGRLLEKNVVDPELREWILPDFSTTTGGDGVVASVIMMGTLQKYFSYTFGTVCGLPSVTLLGTEGDWENILLRLEKLNNHGEEPTTWCGLLKPILARFVKSFQDPESEEVLDFWQKIVHQYNMGSGPTFLSGWITAFCFWDEDGKLLYRDPGPPTEWNEGRDSNFRRNEETSFEAKFPGEKDRQKDWNGLRSPHLVLDGAAYNRVDLDEIPSGYASVPVHVDDDGNEFDTTMIAGSLGIRGTSSGRLLQSGEPGLDTMQPVSGWLIFEKLEEPVKDPREVY